MLIIVFQGGQDEHSCISVGSSRLLQDSLLGRQSYHRQSGVQTALQDHQRLPLCLLCAGHSQQPNRWVMFSIFLRSLTHHRNEVLQSSFWIFKEKQELRRSFQYKKKAIWKQKKNPSLKELTWVVNFYPPFSAIFLATAYMIHFLLFS